MTLLAFSKVVEIKGERVLAKDKMMSDAVADLLAKVEGYLTDNRSINAFTSPPPQSFPQNTSTKNFPVSPPPVIIWRHP